MSNLPEKKRKLIHCITNPISINQCANLILALSCQPIMAEHPSEVCEIAKRADAILLNIGNITDARMESIALASKTAKNFSIPTVFDAVGVACSSLRRSFTLELFNSFSPSVIKGNYSEIKALANSNYTVRGVDSDEQISTDEIAKISKELSKKHGSIILASGKADIICDGNRLICVKNGCSELGRLTGTGCMLGAMVSCFITQAANIDSVTNACAFLGICAELCKKQSGPMSFQLSLIDKISTTSYDDIFNLTKKEELCIEKN